MLRERPEVKLSSHGRKMAKFGRPAPEIEGLVAASELRLMFAFMECWHKETSSFHLPVGEVTITLDDVASLLHLPIIGAFHSFKQLHVDDVVDMLVELLESGTYAWGATALVYMYDNLNEASKSTVRQLAGYITLLKCWIYEHFPSIGSALATEDYDERRLCACQWTSGKALPVSMYHRCLDRLTHDVVCWIPYGDHRSFREFEVISLFFGHLRWGPLTVIHRSKRVLRQFAYIQTIPPHPTAPSVSIEEMDDRWIPTQLGDPPRVPPVQQYDTFVEPDVHQQPDGYVIIADKLERLLNPRILTEGTKVYTVVEECLSITRSCISQPTVGHRSRRRRRTDIEVHHKSFSKLTINYESHASV
ncbi:Protein MAINTENANCE OF MERISTEMS [Glycine soja]